MMMTKMALAMDQTGALMVIGLLSPPAFAQTAPAEHVASEPIGRETVQYVSNIYKYYIAYQLAAQEIDEKSKLKSAR